MHEVNRATPRRSRSTSPTRGTSYSAGDQQGLHPWDGETELNYTGPKPPYEHLDVEGKYSWIKTPRWRDHPMEVGPAGPTAGGLRQRQRGGAGGRQRHAGAARDAPVEALFSTLGRTAARGLETLLVVHWMQEFFDELVTNIKAGKLEHLHPRALGSFDLAGRGQGVGLTEAPRGALAHWIRIKDRKIDNYQLVVPSTWNASPRDARGSARPTRRR